MRRLRNIGVTSVLLVTLAFFHADNGTAVPGAKTTRPEEEDSLSTLPTPQETASVHPTPNDEEIPLLPTPPQQQPTTAPPPEPPAALPLPTGELTPNPNNDNDANPPSQPFTPEFPFQNDLPLTLPFTHLTPFTNHHPHNNPPPTLDPSAPKPYAYATFMATRNPSLSDPYFLAIHSLIHRLLWSPRTRSPTHPIIVYVGLFVTPLQRSTLAAAGAIVQELAPLPWHPDTTDIQPRWLDLFSKLHMWNATTWSRMLFLDADAFPLAPLDAMFDLPPEQPCIPARLEADDMLADGAPVCEPYVFAGVPQDPFNTTNANVNVGAMVFAPSDRMHQRLLQNYVKMDRYDVRMAEQAFLNWQFGVQSAFPATLLGREWGGFFPGEDEEGKLKVVHEKLWVKEGGWMKAEWERGWAEMVEFYQGDEFRRLRAADGLLAT